MRRDKRDLQKKRKEERTSSEESSGLENRQNIQKRRTGGQK